MAAIDANSYEKLGEDSITYFNAVEASAKVLGEKFNTYLKDLVLNWDGSAAINSFRSLDVVQYGFEEFLKTFQNIMMTAHNGAGGIIDMQREEVSSGGTCAISDSLVASVVFEHYALPTEKTRDYASEKMPELAESFSEIIKAFDDFKTVVTDDKESMFNNWKSGGVHDELYNAIAKFIDNADTYRAELT